MGRPDRRTATRAVVAAGPWVGELLPAMAARGAHYAAADGLLPPEGSGPFRARPLPGVVDPVPPGTSGTGSLTCTKGW